MIIVPLFEHLKLNLPPWATELTVMNNHAAVLIALLLPLHAVGEPVNEVAFTERII